MTSKYDGRTPGEWRVETVRTQIGHCHKIVPINACLYVDHRDAKQKDEKTIRAAVDSALLADAPLLLRQRDELLAACRAVLDTDALGGTLGALQAVVLSIESSDAAPAPQEGPSA